MSTTEAGSTDVAYVTQEMWNGAQDALRAVMRVADCMPEGHHRESIRNLIKPHIYRSAP